MARGQSRVSFHVGDQGPKCQLRPWEESARDWLLSAEDRKEKTNEHRTAARLAGLMVFKLVLFSEPPS